MCPPPKSNHLLPKWNKSEKLRTMRDIKLWSMSYSHVICNKKSFYFFLPNVYAFYGFFPLLFFFLPCLLPKTSSNNIFITVTFGYQTKEKSYYGYSLTLMDIFSKVVKQEKITFLVKWSYNMLTNAKYNDKKLNKDLLLHSSWNPVNEV